MLLLRLKERKTERESAREKKKREERGKKTSVFQLPLHPSALGMRTIDGSLRPPTLPLPFFANRGPPLCGPSSLRAQRAGQSTGGKGSNGRPGIGTPNRRERSSSTSVFVATKSPRVKARLRDPGSARRAPRHAGRWLACRQARIGGLGKGGGAALARGEGMGIRMREFLFQRSSSSFSFILQTTFSFSSPPRGLFQRWKQLFSAPNCRVTARSVRLRGRGRSRQDMNAAKKRGKHSKKKKTNLSLSLSNFLLHSPFRRKTM